MKKILLVLVFVGLTSTAFSQITVRPGLRGGISISKITNMETDSRSDFYIGGFVGIKFARFYMLQPELTYSRQGGKEIFLNQDDLEIQYLNFSIANKFYPVPNAGLYFVLGPSVNFKLSDNYDSFYGDDIEGFDFALFGGMGYEFPFGLGFEARFNQGFVDIFGFEYDNEDDFEWDDLYLNSYFQIGVTYKFDF